jgi:hypothetical protein
MAGSLACLATVPLSGQAPQAPQAMPAQHRDTWKVGQFTWVKLVPREAGSPANEHPAALDAAFLEGRLGAVQFEDSGSLVPLFAKDELARLGPLLSEAFAAAGPDQDVILLSTHRRGGSFLTSPKGLTARLFRRDGALQVMVHDARLDFVDQYIGEEVLPAFRFGSRSAAGPLRLACPGAATPRADWLAFPPAAQAPAAPQAAAAPAPAPAAAPTAAFITEQGERLRALQRLRDDHLIGEAEYQKIRQEIMDKF